MGPSAFFPYLLPRKLGDKYISPTPTVCPNQGLENYLDEEIILEKRISDTNSVKSSTENGRFGI